MYIHRCTLGLFLLLIISFVLFFRCVHIESVEGSKKVMNNDRSFEGYSIQDATGYLLLQITTGMNYNCKQPNEGVNELLDIRNSKFSYAHTKTPPM